MNSILRINAVAIGLLCGLCVMMWTLLDPVPDPSTWQYPRALSEVALECEQSVNEGRMYRMSSGDIHYCFKGKKRVIEHGRLPEFFGCRCGQTIATDGSLQYCNETSLCHKDGDDCWCEPVRNKDADGSGDITSVGMLGSTRRRIYLDETTGMMCTAYANGETVCK